MKCDWVTLRIFILAIDVSYLGRAMETISLLGDNNFYILHLMVKGQQFNGYGWQLLDRSVQILW